MRKTSHSVLDLDQKLTESIPPSGYVIRELGPQLFEAVFDSSPYSVTIVDSKYKVVAFNFASENLTGWSKDQVVGQHCWDVFGCTNDMCTGKTVSQCSLVKRNGRRFCMEHSFTSREGREINVSMSHAPLLSPPPNDRHLIIVAHNISVSEKKGHVEPDFLAIASHELLSPLNLIGGYAATLLQFAEELTPEHRSRYLQGIESTTKRSIQIVRNFLEFSRLRGGVLDLAIEPTVLSDLLRQVVMETQERTVSHVIKLRQPRDLPEVYIDRQKIIHVLINLLDNALKYSPHGGNIEVSVRHGRDQAQPSTIPGEDLRQETPCVIVSVKDTGIGIDKLEMEGLFEKFHRVDTVLARTVSGMGIGLYLCKTIINAHGGRIWATSKPGGGSTFSFSLPVVRSTPNEQTITGPQLLYDLKS